jgi:integrase
MAAGQGSGSECATRVEIGGLRPAFVQHAAGVHDLRHSYASLLLLAGEPMLYVKEQLGHATVQVTVDLYGHVRPGLNRGAVNRLAEATRPGSPAVQLHSNYTPPVGT